eukprot:TRINITY_DN1734_c0_g5_i1.p1 TRINITY_DN1734_c0_g5~~TRINITY_DN1734_c0_g5_i1.p1  ORF type:complete len:1126 (+),score=222.59 TRINITY_DN1734_c0_g5_i1:42-3380(+)
MAGVEFVALLTSLRSSDNAARDAAERTFTDAQISDPSRVIASLAGLLNVATCQDEVLRTQAATLLRRATVQVGAKEPAWLKADAAVHVEVKLALFQALETEPCAKVRKILFGCISAVAGHTTVEAPWAQLVPNCFAMAKSSNVVHQDAAFGLLAEMIGSIYTKSIMDHREELGNLVTSGLSTPPLQLAALNLVSEMVSFLDADSFQGLQPVLPLAENALKALSGHDLDAFEDALQSLVSCVAEQAGFFKPRFREWVDMMFTFAMARGNLEDGRRSLAFEWVSTAAETKSKAIVKAVPGFPQKALEVAFAFLSEASEDAGWADIDEDEEDDDDEGLHKAGEAKVDFFVKKLGFKQTRAPLLSLLEQYGMSGRWQDKLGAAMAIRAAAEYVEDSAALDAMATLLLRLAQDEHMRVRYAALLAIGQICHDQEAEFHTRWHSRLVPPLTHACGDCIDRVASMAAGALESVVGDLDEVDLAVHARPVLEVLVAKLRSSSHRGVLVAVMEAVGAVAAGLEGDFDAFYDDLMEMLLTFVSKQGTDPSAAKLRGKAFECISLLGFSVGKVRFSPAAHRAMSAMLATPTVGNDVQTDCIRDAMERTCKIMGPDFAPFLPMLVPGILASIRIESTVANGEGGEEADDELTIPTDDGILTVKISHIQELLAVVGLLTGFIKETGLAFLEYVKPTAAALDGVLRCADPVLNLASSVRDAVFPCWAELVELTTRAVPSQGEVARALTAELVQRFVEKVGADLSKAEDPEDITAMATGIACVIRSSGIGCLQATHTTAICDLAVAEILKSFQREQAIKDGNPLQQDLATGGDDDDDDDEVVGDVGGKGEEEEEQDSRVGLVAILGACMKANPEVFIGHCWPTLQTLMQDWFGPRGGDTGMLLGLHVARDLCEHLGDSSATVWHVFMGPVLKALDSRDAEVRGAAALVLARAARVPAFGTQHGAAAFAVLGASLQRFKARKSDEEAQMACDNATLALVELFLSHRSLCPTEDLCWRAILDRLPLKVALEEGRKLHRRLFVEAQQPSGGRLGSVDRTTQVLGYMCENYGRSELCDEDLSKDFAIVFASLPQATVQALVAQFSPKQQKKAERVLQDGQAALTVAGSLAS